MFYLNGYDRLILDELHSSGTPSRTPFCVRTIAARALEVGAMNVIVAHNHPSGLREAATRTSPRRSRSNARSTRSASP